MKIISWNVNGIRAAYRKGFLDFLRTHNPDVLCVQETKATVDQLTPEQLSPLSRQSYWSSAVKAGYSGVATMVVQDLVPRSVVHGIDVERFDSEGRFVITSHSAFDVYNVYFPNGARSQERHDYKLDFLRVFTQHLQNELRKGKSIVVLGDFNVAHREVDIYDPIRHSGTSGFRIEERQWFDEFLGIGFLDTFRHFHPTASQKYTWWNQIERARLANRGWRIDMICVSESLRSRIRSAEILDHIEGSDHCPIVLEIDEHENASKVSLENEGEFLGAT